MDIKTIGIDLGKAACDAVAMDGRGAVLARRRRPRPQLVLWLANLPPCRIGMAVVRRPPPGASGGCARPRGEADAGAVSRIAQLPRCQFRQDSCRRDWVRFAIFFHRPPAPSARRARSAAMPRARTTARLARSDTASRQSARRDLIPPRGVLHDNSRSPGERALADRRYGPRAATRGVESLASPRNYINIAAAGREG